MEDLFIVLFGLFVIFTCLACVRPVTVLIHELGHAIPALIFTDKKVTMYIGSYGDPENSLVYNIGRLKIFFKYNLFLWNVGLCTFEGHPVSVWKAFLIIVSGPLLSLISGAFVCYHLYSNSFGEGYNFLGFTFFASSIFDFYNNLFGGGNGFYLHNGSLVYRDGQQLVQLLKFRVFSTDIKKATELYNQKKYEESNKIFFKVLNSGVIHHDLFQFTIVSLIRSKKYKKAASIHDSFSKDYSLDSNDYSNLGLIYSKLNFPEKSFDLYNKSLELNPENIYALNNRGYQYSLDLKFEKAILDFNKAIELKDDFAYAINNRGHANIELGFEEKGLNDIEESLKIDPENSYAFRNLGIYYIRKKNKEKAMESLNKAFELDEDTHLLMELIEQAKTL